MKSIHRLTRLALLSALALVLYVIEAQVPPLIPVAGVKLGLANLVTLFALYYFSPADAVMILLTRCLLGALITGQVSALAYSLGGGFASLLFMKLLLLHASERQLYLVSSCGAIAHNLAQISIAVLITATPGLILYLPVLLISGILTGFSTGLIVQYVIIHLNKAKAASGFF